MKIFIEDNQIDFTLENEKNMDQIIKGIEDWLIKDGMMIKELSIDKDIYYPNQAEKLAKIDIEKVEKVEIALQSTAEYALSVIPEVTDYIKRFAKAIEDNDSKKFCSDKQEKLNGLSWIAEMLQMICRILDVNPAHVFHARENLLGILTYFIVAADEANKHFHDNDFFHELFKDKIKDKLNNIIQLFPRILSYASVISEIKSGSVPPAHVIDDFVGYISQMLDEYKAVSSEIAEKMQIGKDFEAYGELKDLISALESPVVILKMVDEYPDINLMQQKLYISDEETTVEKVIVDFLDLINEIVQTLENEDIVYLCDLLEYELSSNIDNISKIINLLPEMLVSHVN